MMGYDDIAALVGIVTSIGILFGIYFGLKQIRLLIETANNEYEWKKRDKSLDYSLTKSEQHRVARLNLERTFGRFELIREALPLSDIDEAMNSNSETATDIRVLLGHWENMALSIHAKVADEDVCYEMVGSSVIKATRVFRGQIDRVRDRNANMYEPIRLTV